MKLLAIKNSFSLMCKIESKELLREDVETYF
jgi:hypothetical protein